SHRAALATSPIGRGFGAIRTRCMARWMRGRQQGTPGKERTRTRAAAPDNGRDLGSAILVGRGRIELPQPKARVLQTLGLTTCPTDPQLTLERPDRMTRGPRSGG